MPETKESARRWSGYVCPDCRCVFRVPMDHGGQGGLCPGCRRVLRIPTAGENLPSLVVALGESAVVVDDVDPSESEMKTLRRKKKTRHGEDQVWDQKSEVEVGSGRDENRQMFWMLIGGVVLFSLMVGVVAMLGGDEAESRQWVVPPPGISVESAAAEADPSESADAAFLAEAKLMVGRFLEAGRIEEMLPLVRNPEVAEARMRSYYPGGVIEAPGMRDFNTGGGFYSGGSSFEVQVRTGDDREQSLAFCDTPEGIKIDWESWVGWSEMPWDELMATRPTTGKLFRVLLKPVTYYNFAFSDERKWNAYRLESPDGKSAVYGYVERNSELVAQLKRAPDTSRIALTLSLKFPSDAETDNQVLIEKIIAKGWLLEPVKTP